MNAGPRRTPKSACANSARAASAGGEWRARTWMPLPRQ